MEMGLYKVGERVCAPSADKTLFDLTDAGGILSLHFTKPTAKEKKAFKDGISFRFLTVDDIIVILVRIGRMQWMDAPYNKSLSLYLTQTEFPEEGYGLAIHAMLIDASTGILVAQKLFSPDSATSQSFLTAVRMQPEIPDYDERLQRSYFSRSTNDFVQIWEQMHPYGV